MWQQDGDSTGSRAAQLLLSQTACGLDMPAVTHVDVCLATLGNTARHMTQAGLSPSACTRA